MDIENPVFTHPVRLQRYNGKCRFCKRKYSTLAGCYSQSFQVKGGRIHNTLVNYGVLLVTADGVPHVSLSEGSLPLRCDCGKPTVMHRVLGKVRADKACDGRCMAATGQDCECACGGKNHGCAHGMPGQS